MRKIRPASLAVHTWVIGYDIEDDARRRRVARMLEAQGRRVQFSVFECRMSRLEAAHLRTRLLSVIDAASDRLRCYPLCRPCLGKKTRQGTSRLGAVIEREGFVVV